MERQGREGLEVFLTSVPYSGKVSTLAYMMRESTQALAESMLQVCLGAEFDNLLHLLISLFHFYLARSIVVGLPMYEPG